MNEVEKSCFKEGRSVETPLGLVVRSYVYETIPPGWRMLRIEEGKKIKEQLNTLTGPYDVIKFEIGALEGSSLGNHFREGHVNCDATYVLKM